MNNNIGELCIHGVHALDADHAQKSDLAAKNIEVEHIRSSFFP
jgi:hypothetical protein